MSSAHDLFKYMAGKIMADDVRKALDAIDDKPECACEKTSNEWKMYSLNSDGQCIHCGRQISHKPEKIEMPEVNITKYGIVHSKEIKNWMQQITKAVNSLKGE